MFLLVNNVPNSVVDQPNNASSSLCKEDRKIDEFLDLVQKKSVSDGIRQRNKKLQQSKLSPSTDDDISASEDYSSCNMCNMKMVDSMDASSDEISGLIEISININEDIGNSRKLLKRKRYFEFNFFDADRLKIWKVQIRADNDKELSELTLHNNDQLLARKGSVEYLGRDRICKATLRESCLEPKNQWYEVRNKIYKFVSYKYEDSLFIDHFPIPWDDVLENRLRQLHSEKGVVDIFWGRSLKEDDTTWPYQKDVELGSSIGIAESRETSGTLSAVVHDKNSKQIGILSCEHVCRFSESSTGMGVIIHQLSHKDLDNLIQSIIDMASKDPKFKEISANAINKINNNRQNSALARIYMYTPEWYNARNNTEKSINSLEKFYELIWPDFETYDTYDIDQNASIDLSEYCDSSYSETETETESISSDSSYFSEAEGLAIPRSPGQPSAKIIPVKITQNKESKMSSSTDNDIVCLNFRLRNAENKNTIKISKNKKVSDLENENPMRTEDRIFPYFNETPDDDDRIHIP
ncbi:hypothetical protein GLOIN_2v1490821 [Rhizophagus irregularis DAOM 181602=DAOM 197198]|nr:hypothetical protein GLOIN_2v1490821 [Rhizophagus irregularis DAOM 181602=DAOM 197198]